MTVASLVQGLATLLAASNDIDPNQRAQLEKLVNAAKGAERYPVPSQTPLGTRARVAETPLGPTTAEAQAATAAQATAAAQAAAAAAQAATAKAEAAAAKAQAWVANATLAAAAAAQAEEAKAAAVIAEAALDGAAKAAEKAGEQRKAEEEPEAKRSKSEARAKPKQKPPSTPEQWRAAKAKAGAKPTETYHIGTPESRKSKDTVIEESPIHDSASEEADDSQGFRVIKGEKKRKKRQHQ